MDTATTDATASPFKINVHTWGHKKFKLKNKFHQLNDADLHFAEGQEGELVARLQARLGKSEAELQKLITEL